MDVEGSEGNFFRAIVNIRRHDFPTARVCIDRARHLLYAELQARWWGLNCFGSENFLKYF